MKSKLKVNISKENGTANYKYVGLIIIVELTKLQKNNTKYWKKFTKCSEIQIITYLYG